MPIRKKYQELTNTNEQEKYISELVKKHHDDELRERWGGMVDKAAPNIDTEIKKNSYGKIFLAIVFIAILAFVLSKINFTKETDTIQYALQEINDPILHPGLTKGVQLDNTTRTRAITSFNAQVFDVAAKEFKNIENKSSEDRFYLAMSHLYLKEYTEAIILLSQLSIEDSDMLQESRWYLAVAYLLNKDVESSKRTLNSIKVNEWKYEEAKKLLDDLN